MSQDIPATIEHEGFEITSSGGGHTEESLKEGFDALSKDKADREAREKGEPTAEEKEQQETTEAAQKLGKKGAEAKKAKPIKALPDKEEPEKEAEPEKKAEAPAEEPKEKTPEEEGAEAEKKAAEDIKAAPPHKRKQLASERVGEATRETAAYKRQVRDLQRQLDALRAAPQPGPAPEKAKFEGKDDEYLEARIQHGVQEALARRAQEQQQIEAQSRIRSEVEENNTRFEQSISAARAKDSEFDSKLWDSLLDIAPHYMVHPNEIGPQNVIMSEIFKSEDPASWLQYFSEHRDDFQRLTTLDTPREISREMVRLEMRRSATAEPTPPAPASVSQAPPPVKPATGAPHTAEPDGYRPGMSFEEFLRADKLGRELLKRSRR